MRTYGITIEDWESLFLAQGSCCGCCKGLDAGGAFGAWNTDHCHTTGIVRGILCHKCNTAIGKLGDTADGVRRALKYLCDEGAAQ